jgi:hypothetical protein
MKNPPQNFILIKNLQSKFFFKKTAKCQQALKDCVSTRKTSLQPKGFSLAGVSKNCAGTKREGKKKNTTKRKKDDDGKGRRSSPTGYSRSTGSSFALIFYTKNFLTGSFFYSWVTLFITLLFLLFLTFLGLVLLLLGTYYLLPTR